MLSTGGNQGSSAFDDGAQFNEDEENEKLIAQMMQEDLLGHEFGGAGAQ